MWVRSLGWKDPLEKEITTHSSILAWKVPCTGEPSRPQSMGLQRVKCDWAHMHEKWKNYIHYNFVFAFSSLLLLLLLSCFSRVWLCKPMGCNPSDSTAHGILQARILEWVTISSSRGSSWPRDQTHISCISCISRQILYHCTTWEAQPIQYCKAIILQSKINKF